MGQIAYHDFEGITVREEEGERLLAHLGDKRILMLRNHGPVVMGRTLPEAFIKYWALQRACEIQLATMSMGQPILIRSEEHTSELQSLMRISYAVFCLKKKKR